MVEKKLKIDHKQVERCREAAGIIAEGLEEPIKRNTTTAVERTVARLLGIDGVDDEGIPLPNVVVDEVQRAGKLNRGIAYWLGNARIQLDKSFQNIAELVGKGGISLPELPEHEFSRIKNLLEEISIESMEKIRDKRRERKKMQEKYPPGDQPWKYVIVATGNIYEDVKQARAAARQGADIIAVIRSTAQSLLDYVPYGATTEGFGGTYATQENFNIMREALDEVGQEEGRYIQLVNYCSGLCMPEIAAMGAMERLDMMLNDSMYGVLFRDINMKRTFIDQYFSRMLNAYV